MKRFKEILSEAQAIARRPIRTNVSMNIASENGASSASNYVEKQPEIQHTGPRVSPWGISPTTAAPVTSNFGAGLSTSLDSAMSPAILRWDKPPTPQEFNKNRNMASGLDYAKFPDDYEFLKDTEVSAEGETYLNPNRLRPRKK